MTQIVLFDNKDNPGPDEFVVIDVDDLDQEALEAEYMATVVARDSIFLANDSLWPINRGLDAPV